MKSKFIKQVKNELKSVLDKNQIVELENVLNDVLSNFEVIEKNSSLGAKPTKSKQTVKALHKKALKKCYQKT